MIANQHNLHSTYKIIFYCYLEKQIVTTLYNIVGNFTFVYFSKLL